MGALVRCIKCGGAFNANPSLYCGDDFCPSCRSDPQDSVISAEKETRETYRNMGYSEEESDRKAYEFALNVERRRREREE